MRSLFDTLNLGLATAITVLLLYIKVDANFLHGGVIVIIIFVLIIFNILQRPLNTNSRKNGQSLLLFFSTLSIEILVISTGGYFSHFLLIAFLFCLAISFFVSLLSAFSFLSFFFLLLVLQVLFDKSLAKLLYQDTVTVFLYLVAFLVVANLAYVLNRSYRVKDLFVKTLHKQLKVTQNQEQSILSSVDELIIITDKNLHIISVNEAVEKMLLLSRSELFQKQLFEVLFLRQETGVFLQKESINLDKILNEKEQVRIDKLHLVVKTGTQEVLLTLHIRPILDLDGSVDQILFIISNTNQVAEKAAEDFVLDQIITKHQAMIEELKRTLINQQMLDLAFKAEVIGKIDREILYLIALQDASFINNKVAINMARLGKNVVLVMEPFAKAMHVNLQYKLLNIGNTDMKNVQLAESQVSIDEMTRTLYTAQADMKWLEIMLHKLCDIAILLSSNSQTQQVVLSLEKAKDTLTIKITSSFNQLTINEINYLFTLNYGPLLNKTNLMISSGLEGFIANLIADKLNIPITTSLTSQNIEFSINL